MANIPVLSSFWNYLTAPSWPSTAVALTETNVALTSLRRRSGEFEPRNLGVVRLPKGLLKASFTELNITNEAELVERLNEATSLAALRRLRRVTARLPSGSARSLVFSVDTLPTNKQEAAQMIEWKIERSFGVPYVDLRADYRRLRDFNGKSQWLATATHRRVIEQYEQVFQQLGWQVGLVLPQALGEAQWLLRSMIPEDQALVSVHAQGFDVVVVREGEPILVREVVCSPEEREDEFFRVLVFYRDRLQPENGSATLARLLVLGDAYEQRRFREVLFAALEQSAVGLDANQVGLRVEPQAPFREMAAATGLATLAWS